MEEAGLKAADILVGLGSLDICRLQHAKSYLPTYSCMCAPVRV